MDWKKESKAVLFLLLLFIFSTITMYFLSNSMEYLKKINSLLCILFFLGYIGLLFLSNWLREKFRYKVFEYLNILISIPYFLIVLIFQLTRPTMVVVVHFFVFSLFCLSIPYFLFRINDYFELLEFTYQTRIFIYITFATCASVALYKQIINLVYISGPYRTKTSEKVKRYKLEELTNYIINKENVRFTIYSLFFIYLLIFSFQYLQNSSIFGDEIDRAVYQSFLCFLAFDRLLLNAKMFVVTPSEFLKRMTDSIFGEEDEDKKEEENNVISKF